MTIVISPAGTINDSARNVRAVPSNVRWPSVEAVEFKFADVGMVVSAKDKQKALLAQSYFHCLAIGSVGS